MYTICVQNGVDWLTLVVYNVYTDKDTVMEAIVIKEKRKTERFWMRMEPTLRERIDRAAKNADVSASEFARQILEQAVAQYEQQRS